MFMVFFKGKELDRDAGYAGPVQLQRWVAEICESVGGGEPGA